MTTVSHRSQQAFLFLVIAQAAHSVEEYATRLYDVFAPARFVSGLVSDDLALGFAIVNVCIVAIGFFCYVGPVRSGGAAARVVAWVWTVIELANGVGHITFAVSAAGYFPGAVTAVALLCAGAYLARGLQTDGSTG
jgi:hypothetical protein